jgi:membrane protein
VVPANTVDLIEAELTALTSETQAVGWSLLVSLVVTLYSGSKAVAGIMTGLNIAYGERDKRGFFRKKLLALGLTFGSVVFLAVVLTLLVAVPLALRFAGLANHSEWILGVLRWPVLAVVAMSWISVLYKIGPDRSPPRWKWVTWGSVLAVAVWFMISVGLSIYASSFPDLSKTYGSLGAIVLLLLWFYGFGWAVLAGAELNAEIERQTQRDSTTGPPKPMGERGAFAADSLGEVP